MIQLIDKQVGRYKLVIHNIECTFIPPFALFVGDNLLEAKPFIPKGKSVLKYCVGDKQVSYNQIKAAIGVSKRIKNRVATNDPILKLLDDMLPEWARD